MSGRGNTIKKAKIEESTTLINDPLESNVVIETVTVMETPQIGHRAQTDYYARGATNNERRNIPDVLLENARNYEQLNETNDINMQILDELEQSNAERITAAVTDINNNIDRITMRDQELRNNFDDQQQIFADTQETGQALTNILGNETTNTAALHGNTTNIAEVTRNTPVETPATDGWTLWGFVQDHALTLGITGTILLGGAYWYFRSNNTETTATQTIGQGLAAAAAGGSFSASKQENKGFINVNINKK